MSFKHIWNRIEKLDPPNTDIEVRVSYTGELLPEPLPGQHTFDIYCDYGDEESSCATTAFTNAEII